MARQKKRKVPVNIPICLAIILLFLTLISVRLSGGIVARYTTTTDSGDSARVIEFGDISLTETVSQPYIAPGASLEWNAAVSFTGSESATYVFVEITGVYSGNATTVTLFSGGPSWTVADGWTCLGEYTKDNVTKYVYYLALAPNATLENVPFFKESVSDPASEELTAEQIAALGSITPAFRASVVQSNGFDSPGAAWTSLEDNH